MPDLIADDQWLSIGEAADILNLSRDTLRRWEKNGKIKVYRSPTNRRIYKKEELENLFRSTGKTTPPAMSGVALASPSPATTPSIATPVSPMPTSLNQPSPVIEEDHTEVEEELDSDKIDLSMILEEDQPTRPPEKPLQMPSSAAVNLATPAPPSVTTSTPLPTISPPLASGTVINNSPTLANRLPTVPTQINLSQSTQSSSSPSFLKVTAIVLALILILLGITVTILVFV